MGIPNEARSLVNECLYYKTFPNNPDLLNLYFDIEIAKIYLQVKKTQIIGFYCSGFQIKSDEFEDLVSEI